MVPSSWPSCWSDSLPLRHCPRSAKFAAADDDDVANDADVCATHLGSQTGWTCCRRRTGILARCFGQPTSCKTDHKLSSANCCHWMIALTPSTASSSSSSSFCVTCARVRETFIATINQQAYLKLKLHFFSMCRIPHYSYCITDYEGQKKGNVLEVDGDN